MGLDESKETSFVSNASLKLLLNRLIELLDTPIAAAVEKNQQQTVRQFIHQTEETLRIERKWS
jgi:hypothetical protein